MRPFLIFSGAIKSSAKFLKVQSTLSRSVIGLRFFLLKSADVRGAGTRYEPLRTSAWEATKGYRSDKIKKYLV